MGKGHSIGSFARSRIEQHHRGDQRQRIAESDRFDHPLSTAIARHVARGNSGRGVSAGDRAVPDYGSEVSTAIRFRRDYQMSAPVIEWQILATDANAVADFYV